MRAGPGGAKPAAKPCMQQRRARRCRRHGMAWDGMAPEARVGWGVTRGWTLRRVGPALSSGLEQGGRRDSGEVHAPGSGGETVGRPGRRRLSPFTAVKVRRHWLRMAGCLDRRRDHAPRQSDGRPRLRARYVPARLRQAVASGRTRPEKGMFAACTQAQ